MPQRYDINTVREYAKACTNWGKWGPDDEFGTLNYITPQKIREAAGLVKDGKVISLSTDFNADGPQKQSGRAQRFNPIHLMLRSGADALVGAQAHRAIQSSDDVIIMPLQCATQWDSLAHIFFEGKMYNGYDISLVNSFGAQKNGIDKCKSKIVSRGVLLDIAAYKGKPWLEPGDAIYPDDLTGCAEKEGVKVGAGDILLVRTGQMKQGKEQGWGEYAGGSAPGFSVTVAPWIYERQIAAVATDTWGTEVLPNETEGVFQPLHIILIVHAGLLVGEIFDLEELAADCQRDGRYDFMFVAPPLVITGAVGSPINPQAIK